MNSTCLKFDFNTQDTAGFTFVELMVAVSIVGILAAIAIPSYQASQVRFRQSEAKINLTSLYTAEISYASMSGTFGICLEDMGFKPIGTTRYYAIGFSSTMTSGSNTCGLNRNSACNVMYTTGGVSGSTCVGASGYDATVVANPSAPLPLAINLRSFLTSTTFNAQAVGYIAPYKNSTYDHWQMTDQMYMRNDELDVDKFNGTGD